jgi:2-oxoglutarate dehydrogenase E2 component (dihydrolipoamide succinyltransferase)
MSIDIVVPTEQEGTKAVVKSWLKRPGDIVRLDDPLVELETDKVTVEIASPSSGVLSEILVKGGEEVEPGTVLGRIAGSTEISDDNPAASRDKSESQRKAAPRDMEALPPGIRRLLAEHGLEAREVPISGAKLTREDIIAEAARRADRNTGTQGSRRIPHDTMRKRIAEHMSQSVRVAPHVTSVFEADFTAITAHREANKAAFARQSANLTFTAYFVAASAAAMKAAPAVNARWHDDYLELFEDVNIGVGTALGEKGLVVPVIRRAQTLSLLEIAKALTDLTERARGAKLTQDDVRGGTFSISNHGVSGSLVAAPIIINQPQSAILGVGKLEKRAVVRNDGGEDRVLIRPMAYVTLTIDHRVIDAVQTNAWLTKFVATLENWPLEI